MVQTSICFEVALLLLCMILSSLSAGVITSHVRGLCDYIYRGSKRSRLCLICE